MAEKLPKPKLNTKLGLAFFTENGISEGDASKCGEEMLVQLSVSY